MFRTAFLATLLCAGAAQAQQLDPEQMAQNLFDTMDANGNGQLTLREALDYDQQVLTSMDGDESDGASLEEFLSWGIGFQALADQRERGTAYETAGRILFGLMDYDNDGEMTLDEMNQFQTLSFEYADQNQDFRVSPAEFYDHYPLNISVRAALIELQ